MTDTRIARLCDEQEVRDACMAYWAGWDRGDPARLLGGFTPEATLSLFGGKRVLKIADLAVHGTLSAGYAHTSHAPSSQVVTVAGDSATADTLVTCHLVGVDGTVRVRGLRYLDDLMRTTQGWRITHRQHFVLWQYDAPLVEPEAWSEVPKT